ncbi:MAG TPA: hypothetical protein VN256_12785 [Pyrinomonadaceae bacterium]|nr:hypothetical protein [Pyrinomonadaceae bacterium]
MSQDRVGRTIINLLLLVFAVLLFAFASAVAQVLVEPDALRPETRLAGGRGRGGGPRRPAPRNLNTLEER